MATALQAHGRLNPPRQRRRQRHIGSVMFFPSCGAAAQLLKRDCSKRDATHGGRPRNLAVNLPGVDLSGRRSEGILLADVGAAETTLKGERNSLTQSDAFRAQHSRWIVGSVRINRRFRLSVCRRRKLGMSAARTFLCRIWKTI
jgi:hypothetical protein